MNDKQAQQAHQCKFEHLKNNMKNIYKEKGIQWISQLPVIVDKLRDHWKLSDIVPVDNMSLHFVATAKTESNEPVILKVGFDKKVMESEKKALAFFDGEATAKLFDCQDEYNAMLLEQAIPGVSLKSFYPDNVELVMNAYIDTVKKLHRKSLPQHHTFPHVSDWLRSIENASKDKLPAALLEKAITLKNALSATAKNEKVLHGDLHHDNILQHGDGWMAIDPKGVIGELEFEIAAFDVIAKSEMQSAEVKNIFYQRVKNLSEKSKLDEERIKNWMFVRLILSAAWSIEDDCDPGLALNLANLIS